MSQSFASPCKPEDEVLSPRDVQIACLTIPRKCLGYFMESPGAGKGRLSAGFGRAGHTGKGCEIT
eukprot:158026-Amorphochlora_amoeboformis.AAC.2